MPQATRATAPYTKILGTDEFTRQLQHAAVSVLQACEPNNGLFDESMRSINICDGLYLINHIAVLKNWNELTRKIFLQCFMAADSKISSSGIFACYAFAKLLLTKNNLDLLNISHTSRFTNEKNAKLLLRQLVKDGSIELLFDLLNYVGTRGQVNVNTGSKTGITLEIFSGHNFDIGVDSQFCTNIVKRDTAQLFLVDGVVEDIGEIDRLLQYCNESHATCIIVARKFGDDVISTLNVNFQRKTLDVIPLCVNDKLTNLNVFSDLGITTNSNVVESSSGQTTAGFDFGSMQSISGVVCSLKNFSFNALPDTSRNIDRRIKKLRQRIYTEMIHGALEKEDIDTLLRTRINSLNMSSATLWLPAGSNKNGLYDYVSLRFKFGLGLLDNICKTGIISPHISEVQNIFDDLQVDFLPAGIMINSLLVADNIVKSINAVGGCLVLEENQ